ncbi:HAF repeat/PEP-CTERM domain-containing protein [Microcystis flos-aquae FACHB-1344]|uniref:HAF repeat/PEP-CTERM domain-containing protein n=1 Tax=Microcystis flos-aquae FACHB-1344 TaxID=2692899 RepID=A0ABR8HQ49_9CHRO|nr:HAF repeat/PEP-CTERM domain-containing protein [Microcystis flos-aquae]MBD2620846.1 HAF repeat/PEP-CTERM domain-containing protein [Microcystis flos-aquae FACHB-1344]
MNKILANCISLGIGLGAIGVAFQAQAASFQGLGDLPGGIFGSAAYGVSADGSVVVGRSETANGTDFNSEAFRWTQATGMVGLGYLPAPPCVTWTEIPYCPKHIKYSSASGVSGDGSVVVGSGSLSSAGDTAFRWTQAGGMVVLEDLPGTRPGDVPGVKVSADGSVVVSGGYRWTQETGAVGLGDLLGGFSYSRASGVSADGSVVVGKSGDEAFRWTQGTGMVGLGYLPGVNGFLGFSEANGVSADGSVVVGSSSGANGGGAFRWTQAGGMVGLGVLSGGIASIANGVSADGSVVVGYSATDPFTGAEAFIWNSAQGMRSLQQVLTNDYGLDLTGWSLNRANAISADGLTVVGYGTNPNGLNEAWIARLDGEPVSQPGTTPTNPLLPTPNPSNPDGFTFPGVPVGDNGLGTTNPIFFDPIVSVGYDYAVTGGPLFASVLIPNALPQGDSNFILELPGFGNYSLVAGTTFNLLGVNPLGFSDFRISDIDPAEMLDPTNPTAFVTGLTFTAAGTVTVT